MQAVTTIGLDIAKSVFQVHDIDAEGKVLIRRQLKRRYVLALFQKLPPCLVGIEACATSHHWSRQLKASPPQRLSVLRYFRALRNPRRSIPLPPRRWSTSIRRRLSVHLYRPRWAMRLRRLYPIHRRRWRHMPIPPLKMPGRRPQPTGALPHVGPP